MLIQYPFLVNASHKHQNPDANGSKFAGSTAAGAIDRWSPFRGLKKARKWRYARSDNRPGGSMQFCRIYTGEDGKSHFEELAQMRGYQFKVVHGSSSLTIVSYEKFRRWTKSGVKPT
jgi:hypothetical protein